MFKIDKVGFYKNRKGERIHIYRCPTSGVWKDAKDRVYCQYGFHSPDHEYNIIAHWEEPLELEEFKPNLKDYPVLPELEKNADGYLQFAHETDCESKEKFYAVTSNASNTGILFTYDTLEQAQEGAKSLAKYEPDIKFYILETIACYTAEVEIKEIKI